MFVDLVGKAQTTPVIRRSHSVPVSWKYRNRAATGAPDPAHPLPKFSPPSTGASRRYAHWSLFDEGTIGRAGLALERALNVEAERPPGF